jgi:hypothetical protein
MIKLLLLFICGPQHKYIIISYFVDLGTAAAASVLVFQRDVPIWLTGFENISPGNPRGSRASRPIRHFRVTHFITLITINNNNNLLSCPFVSSRYTLAARTILISENTITRVMSRYRPLKVVDRVASGSVPAILGLAA